jgi:hypothetical protein
MPSNWFIQISFVERIFFLRYATQISGRAARIGRETSLLPEGLAAKRKPGALISGYASEEMI